MGSSVSNYNMPLGIVKGAYAQPDETDLGVSIPEASPAATWVPIVGKRQCWVPGRYRILSLTSVIDYHAMRVSE